MGRLLRLWNRVSSCKKKEEEAFEQLSASSPFGSQSVFGLNNNANNKHFASKPFGSSSTPAFGASSTRAFGASSSAFGGSSVFGQKPAFREFGSTLAQSSPFGFQASQPAFGSSVFGSFTAIGAPSQPAFGASSTPASGAISFSAFGATNAPAFGSPASTGLGASSPSLYSASSTPAKDSLTKQKNRRVMELVSESDSDSDDDCVIHPIVVLKNICDMRQYEESEECFVLDFDPYEATADLGSEKVMTEAREIDEGVVVISEKGQVACRDYTHSRLHCVKFPYDKTLPESYCELCYCYVCDTAAPCKFWRLPVPGHCYASDHTADWKLRRETARLGKMKLK
ncbi:unnamed protein product [Rhodiola kirilowii]